MPPRYVPAKKLTGRSSLYPNTSNATPTRSAAPLISCAGALAAVLAIATVTGVEKSEVVLRSSKLTKHWEKRSMEPLMNLLA